MKPLSEKEIAWEAALDWLFKLHESPQDLSLIEACNRWQQADPEHAKAWFAAQRVWQLTGAVLPEEITESAISPDINIRNIATISPSKHSGTPRWRKFGSVIGIAASALFILVFTFNTLTGADYQTGRAETYEAQLSDGSTITLAANTQLDINFTSHQRTAQLYQGAVFFDIAKDATRPFIVQHGDTRVEVLGTAFEVIADEKGLNVHVQQGSVWVQNAQLPKHYLTAALQPSDLLRLDYEKRKVSREQMDIMQIAAWRQGQLIIKNQRVDDVIRQLNKHYQGYMLIKDDALAAQRISGVFDLNDPKAALITLVEPYGAEIKSYSPWVLVVNNHPIK